MSVEEYEESCRKKLEKRNEVYERLIFYLKTGNHKIGLTRTERRKVLRMVSTYRWDDDSKHVFSHMIIF